MTTKLTVISVTALIFSFWIPNNSMAGGAEQQVCDVSADYSLGVEDYSEAIRRHVEVVRKYPDNALAHYHLGFALGMAGDRTSEIKAYHRAEALGLKSWDLFLNFGLAQIQDGDLGAATDSLRQAVQVGGNHAEAHYNLALVEQQRGMLTEAEHETLASLRLDPGQPEARNLLGVIYAREGESVRASLVWSDLVHEVPDYQPAQANLAILGSQGASAHGEAAAVDLPPAAAVRTIGDIGERLLPAR